MATRAAPPRGEGTLKYGIQLSRGIEARGEKLRETHEANIGSIEGRLNRVRSGANLAAQRAGNIRFGGGPRGFRQQLDQAVKRGKARQGIEARGEKAIRNQQLKDRMTLARQSIAKRGQILNASANAARLRAGGEANAADARARVSSAYAGAAGAIAGGALRGFGDRLFGPDTGAAVEEADVAANYGNANLDYNTLGSGYSDSGLSFDGSFRTEI